MAGAVCVVCGQELPQPVRAAGRRRVFCSRACQQKAYRRRQREKVAALEAGAPWPVPSPRGGSRSLEVRQRRFEAHQEAVQGRVASVGSAPSPDGS